MRCTCNRCGSYAINPHLHGREPDVDLDLCDVCYWRKRAESECGDWIIVDWYAHEIYHADTAGEALETASEILKAYCAEESDDGAEDVFIATVQYRATEDEFGDFYMA